MEPDWLAALCGAWLTGRKLHLAKNRLLKAPLNATFKRSYLAVKGIEHHHFVLCKKQSPLPCRVQVVRALVAGHGKCGIENLGEIKGVQFPFLGLSFADSSKIKCVK